MGVALQRWLRTLAVLWMVAVGLAACAGPSSQISDDEILAAKEARPEAETTDDDALFGKVDTAVPHLEVAMVDVGQGDGMVIRGPSGHVIVLDTGKNGDPIVDYLRANGITRVDLLVLTHPHADHIGGADEIIEAVEVQRVLDPLSERASQTYEKLLTSFEARGIPVLEGRRGRRVKLDEGIELLLLAPPNPHIHGTRSDANSNSVVMRLTYGRISILFMGDAEHETEESVMAAAAEMPLGSTILKVAHHGSRYASHEAFLAMVQPKVALISCGKGNTYGHPAPETLERLAKHTPHVFRTDEVGTIRLLTDGKHITISSERGLPVP